MKEESIYTRTEAMLGSAAIERLRSARVIVFGVGGFATEALARAGVGHITVVDSDKVSISNLNRQIIATQESVGMYKTDAIMQRIVSINPDIEVKPLRIFYGEATAGEINFSDYDYVLDCIDSVRSKLLLIESAVAAGVPVISSMGTGNKLDPTRLSVTDLSKTHTDPLAKVVRTELRKREINHLKVVFSDEPPLESSAGRTPGSVPFVPSVAGLIMAGEVIRELIAN